MPNVTSVTLYLQPGGGITGNPNRTARVTFTTTFNATEEMAGVVFKADVVIRSVDGTTLGTSTRTIGSAFIKAAPGTITTTVTKVLTRQSLDEDDDTTNVPPPDGPLETVNRDDEWLATVTLSPAVFGTATRDSDQVHGSWGAGGPAAPATPVVADPPNTN